MFDALSDNARRFEAARVAAAAPVPYERRSSFAALGCEVMVAEPGQVRCHGQETGLWEGAPRVGHQADVGLQLWCSLSELRPWAHDCTVLGCVA